MTDTDTHALHESKEQAYRELQELGKHISTAIRELKERREKRNELTRLAQEQKQVRKDLSKVIKEKITEVKTLRAKRGDKPAAPAPRAPAPSHGGHGFRGRGDRDERETPAKLKLEISRLETKLETSAMDFKEEQKLTKIVKEKKALLAKMGGDNDLDRTIRSSSKEIDKLKKDSDVAHEKVTLAAKESQEHHERILELSKKIEEWKARETVLQEQYGKLKEQLNSKADALPAKKTARGKSASTTTHQHSAADEAVLKEKVAEVEEKVKTKQKLTTEDLLAFQAKK